MSDYPTSIASTDKEDDDIYVRLSLSKYPFLKNFKHGDSGEANFKGEITSSEKNDDDESIHQVTFSDLTNKREKVRV